MAELEKETKAAISKVAALEKEKQAALTKTDEIEWEKECTANKVALLEREGAAAFSKIAVLEKEKKVASSKIEELEKVKEDAARKIALLEKELETKAENFGKYKNAQLQKEEELRTMIDDFKRHANAKCKIEKEVAMSKIAMLEKELETKEVKLYKQAIRALGEIHVEDKEPREKMNELTITMQKLTEERNYWETLAKKLKGKESGTAELLEARKEIIRVWVFGHSFGAYVFFSYALRLIYNNNNNNIRVSVRNPYHYLRGEIERLFLIDPRLKNKNSP